MPSWITHPTFGSAVGLGGLPENFAQKQAIDGTIQPWSKAPVGNLYLYKPNETYGPILYIKRTANNRTDDWVILGEHCIQQRVLFSQFTDGLGTSGTLAITETIPIGAFVTQVILQNVTGFTGDTTATIRVGDGTTVDRYMTGTPSVFTTANAIDLGVPSGTKIHTAAATITLTVTSGSDFTLVAAGAATLRLYYRG